MRVHAFEREKALRIGDSTIAIGVYYTGDGVAFSALVLYIVPAAR